MSLLLTAFGIVILLFLAVGVLKLERIVWQKIEKPILEGIKNS